jgi:hypothetical protein
MDNPGYKEAKSEDEVEQKLNRLTAEEYGNGWQNDSEQIFHDISFLFVSRTQLFYSFF